MVHASNDAVHDLVLGGAAGSDSVDTIAAPLRRMVDDGADVRIAGVMRRR